MRKPTFCICENKGADQLRSFAETAKLISTFVFATRIVQSLFFLSPKFHASSHLLCLYSSVCVRPVQKPHCWLSLDAAHISMLLGLSSVLSSTMFKLSFWPMTVNLFFVLGLIFETELSANDDSKFWQGNLDQYLKQVSLSYNTKKKYMFVLSKLRILKRRMSQFEKSLQTIQPHNVK